MRSERKCSIFDLLWPDSLILKGESLSCLTRVYLCAKIETIWSFDPCHKNFIFVWFLHGCPLNTIRTNCLNSFIIYKGICKSERMVWLAEIMLNFILHRLYCVRFIMVFAFQKSPKKNPSIVYVYLQDKMKHIFTWLLVLNLCRFFCCKILIVLLKCRFPKICVCENLIFMIFFQQNQLPIPSLQ